MQTIKALTILDPWAHFFILNTDSKPNVTGDKSEPFKQYETRSWKTDYRGPIAIHVGKRILADKEIFMALHHVLFPQRPYIWSWLYYDSFGFNGDGRGCIIAIANLEQIYQVHYTQQCDNEPFTAFARDIVDNRHQIVIRGRETEVGDWSERRYAWKLTDVRPIVPIPAKGKQGLWNWTAPEGATFK